MATDKSTARLAGGLYLLLVLTGIFNLIYVPSQLIVMRDPITTLEQISAGRLLFAAGVSIGLISYMIYLCLPVVLYRILASFGVTWARLMVGFVAASIPISFVALTEMLGVLDLIAAMPASGEPGFAELAQQVIERIERYRDLSSVASIFWGLWLFPFGLLAWRARLLPRVLALLLMLGSVGFLIEFFAPLFFGGFHGSLAATIIGAPSSIGEIGACLWLLLGPMKGLRSAPA